MLRNFRQVFKGNKTPMTLVMGVVLLGLVAYLAPSGRGAEMPGSVVARVYGREILRQDVERASAEIMKRMGKQQNMEQMLPYFQAQAQGQALRQLTNQKLIEELAERHGILVTDLEVRNALEMKFKQYPDVFFDKDGKLKSTTEINDILHRNGITLKQWEDETHEQGLGQKLMEQASSLIPVDEAWINQENRIRNEKLTFEFSVLAPDTASIPDPGDGPLSSFLQTSGARFQTGPRRVLQYVALDKESMGDSLSVDDAAIKAAYESKKAQYTELQASHILFKASNEAQFAEATAKAKDLRAKLVAGQNFSKAAEEFTEDPSGKGHGGQLPKFKLGSMVKPFEDAALAMKVGEISQPVKTDFGIHLIKLEGRSEKSLDEVKGELKAQLMQERFTTKAKDRLEQLRKRAGERGDLSSAAKALTLKVQMSTPMAEDFTSGIEGLPDSAMLVGEAFRMKVGDVSKVKKAGDRFVVFRVQEEKSITVPPLAEIRAKVLNAWKLEEARKRTADKAKAALQSGDLKSLAAPTVKENVTIQSLGEISHHPAIRKALLDTAVGALTPALWNSEGQIWIARIKTRTPAEALNFEKRQALVQELQSTNAQNFLEAEVKDLDAKGRLRPGFSSLWGYMNGIWTSSDASKAMPELSED